MTPARLIEPLALLTGAAAIEAVSSGQACPLAGGPAAFALCALIEDGDRVPVPVSAVPPAWHAELTAVSSPVADAGLPPGPLVMGILNVTPDSFSDGGRYLDADAAIRAGLAMREAGADLVDVGGESTRPGATPVSGPEEVARVLPVVRALVAAGVSVSVDTRNAVTMRAVLDAGAALINDVSALTHDREAAAVVAASGRPVALMHMRGTPATMNDHARYADVAVEVVRELSARIDDAVAAGVRRDRILVDPGIGFAKTTAHNLDVLRRLAVMANLGCRMLLGVSRKRFVGEISGAAAPRDRVAASVASALPGLMLPGTILRVHDVAETRQAVRMTQAMLG
ncbi:dihydropteroate synthase [Rhizosaccharibacter radicis]|uniref:Dihydropteroate synthase n=1 Tax=Rhizosaccharibacter radicis TaxID=2782605 RepID=A0ABT1VVQ0_9PROT|nr:dihydropteroate synthase [Acetobacteraceae bacterium KSS12]